MELIAPFIAALLGWKLGTLGLKELKAVAIVVLGWTTVTTLASLPYVTVEGVLYVLVVRALLIGVPYTLAALLMRWRRSTR